MPTGALIGGTVLSAGTSLLGGLAQKSAADKATQVQKDALAATRADLAPYNATGKSAMTTLGSFYGLDPTGGGNNGQMVSDAALEAFKRSPDYQFALAEGIKARDQGAAAKGLLLSGGAQKELAQFSSGLASQNLGNYLNRLYQIAGLGENAAAQTGNAAVSSAKGMAATELGSGEALASGLIGAGNAVNKGVSSYVDNLSSAAKLASLQKTITGAP